VLVDRRVLVGLAVLVQCGIVAAAVAGPLSARLTGQEYLLRVAPYDPIDPFRGAYVSLTYPDLISQPSADSSSEPRATVFVPLVRDGTVWKGAAVTVTRPTAAPYLRCEDQGWELRCGIESWFLPQGGAAAAGRALAGGHALARITVDGRGNAALIDLMLSDRVPVG
jgi:uncharacterized membrane-anchored protein